jgi:phosphoglycerol transferase MdoB-like AlkP superfamily enzyme
MRSILIYLAKRLIFWMLFFVVMRALFLIYYASHIQRENIPFGELILTFYHAFALDLSTAAYILLISYLLLVVFLLSRAKLFYLIEKVYASVVILAFVLITTAELGLYAEWNTKLSYKALSYLQNPSEVFNSVATALFVSLILLWLGLSAAGFFVYTKLVAKAESITRPRFGSLWTLLFVPALLLLAIRGGIQEIPITTSSAYFSRHNILNLAAVNSGYNMLVNTLDSRRFGRENLFKSMDDATALHIVEQLHAVEGDSTMAVLNTTRPNIVIVLLESWSADLIESLGGEPGITPNFRELESKGLLFTQFYASANRSQQAMSSIYAGLPGIPITVITNHPEKYAALPSFVKDMKQQGYYTSFYFGGQLIYGNILSYLMYNGFDRIIEGKDLNPTFTRGKLGVHDQDLLSYYATALNNHPQPFFSTVFTLSSHSPYDFPMEHIIQWPETEKEFVNSAHYTDKALGRFFEIARSQPWYENSLFVILADHSHLTYRNHPMRSFEYHKIPLLLYGPALKDEFRGKTFDVLAGNTDLPATLMAQLNMHAADYFWSKNVFNHYYNPFAFFELNEGLGWKRSEGEFVWNLQADHYYVKNIDPEHEARILQEGKAYLQVLFEEFLSY